MQRILVIRNDKLGDFMLAWPAFSLIKKQNPHSSVTALVPGYTRPVAELCPWIDELIIDDRHESTLADAVHLSRLIRAGHFDASISLYSEMRTALALWLARVPVRIGPATKLAQVFLNRRLRQKRSMSRKPEYEYNADLVRYFITLSGDEPDSLPAPPFMQFDTSEVTDIMRTYRHEHNIDENRRLVFIHAGSGGSAINLSLQQFAELIKRINQSGRFHFVLTAGPGELDTANALSELIPAAEHTIYHSTQGLENFSKFIAGCDLFISGSTGPLHIAGALNVPTAAFYPARQSATALRWQTLNHENRRLAFSPEKFGGDRDMQTIDMKPCAEHIISMLGRDAAAADNVI
jgi:ADP-heptose:LPS heptosyltransferase